MTIGTTARATLEANRIWSCWSTAEPAPALMPAISCVDPTVSAGHGLSREITVRLQPAAHDSHRSLASRANVASVVRMCVTVMEIARSGRAHPSRPQRTFVP